MSLDPYIAALERPRSSVRVASSSAAPPIAVSEVLIAALGDDKPSTFTGDCKDAPVVAGFGPWSDFSTCEKEASMGDALRSVHLGCAGEEWLRINCRKSCGLCHLDNAASAIALPAAQALAAARAVAAHLGLSVPRYSARARSAKISGRRSKANWIVQTLGVHTEISAADAVHYAMHARPMLRWNRSALTVDENGDISGSGANLNLVVKRLGGDPDAVSRLSAW